MTITTLESWRIIVENEHNDVQKILDDWENEQQAALLTEKELEDKIADLVDALKATFPYIECQCYERSEYEGECLGCGCEIVREKANQALALVKGDQS